MIWIGSVEIIVSFIISFMFSKNNKDYMKGFSFVILISLLLSINTICGRFFFLYDVDLYFFIQSVLNLLDLFFWTLFFLRLLNDKKNSRIIKILSTFTLSLAIYILYYNRTSSTSSANLHIIVLLNICKTIFCIYFYHNLFKKLSTQNILSEPSFWIVNGLIFYSCLSLPFYGLNNYIKLQFSISISNNIFSISNMLIIIMYLFFIKAYLCKTHLHKA